MGLQDIQIQIILGVQGLANVGAVAGAIANVTKKAKGAHDAADAIVTSNFKQAKSWGAVITQIGEAERKYDAVYRAAYRITQVGQQIENVGLAGIKMLKDAVTQWGDYEFTLNRAAGAMEVFDKASVIYQHLKTGIYDAARELRLFPAEEVAKATYFWQSTTGEQIKTLGQLNQMLGNVKVAMQVAALTQTDYESVIKGGYSIMKQYGLSLSDIPDILKTLFLETQRTALEFPDLIQAFKYVGPIAHVMGASFKDVAKWLGIIGDLGQRGGISGRALSMLFTQIVRPSAKAKAAANELFLSVMHVKNGYNTLFFPKGKFIGFEKYVTLLAKATDGLTQQQKLQYITSIVGTQNSARIIIPLIDAQSAALKKHTSIFKDAKYSAAGAAKVFAAAWDLLAKSWKGVVGGLQETVEPIILMVGERIAKAMTPFINALSDVLYQVQLWIRENPGLVDIAVQIVAIGAGALAAVGGVLVFLGTMMGLWAVLSQVGAAILFIVGPIAVMVAVVAGAATAIIHNTGGIRDALANLMKVLGEVFGEASDGGKAFQINWGTVLDFIKGELIGAIRKFADAINWIATAIETINKDPTGHEVLILIAKALLAYAAAASLAKGASLGLLVLGGTLKGFSLLLGPLKALMFAFSGIPAVLRVVGAAFGAFSTVVTAALDLIVANPVIALIIGIAVLLFLAWQTNFLGIRDIVANVIAWFNSTAAPAIGKFIGDVAAFVGPLVAKFGDVWNTIMSIVGTAVAAISGFLDQLGGAWNTVSSVVGEAVATIVGLLARLAAPFLALVTKYWPSIVGGISSTVGKIGDVIGHLADVFNQIFNGSILPTVKNVVGTFIDSFKDIASRIGPLVGSIANLISALAGVISTVFGAVVDFIIKNFLPVWDVIVTVITVALGIVGSILKSALDAIITLIGPFGEFMIRTFGNAFEVVGAIVSGAMKIITGIIDAALAVIKGIIDAVTAALKGDWGGVWDAIVGIVVGVFDAMTKVVSGALQIIGGVIGGGLKFLVDLFRLGFQLIVTVVGAVVGNIIGIGKAIVTGLWGAITGLIGWLLNNIVGFVGKVIKGYALLIGLIWKLAVQVVVALWQGISSMVGWLIANIPGFVGSLIGAFGTLVGLISTVAVNVVVALWQGINSMIGWLVSNIPGFIKSVIDGFGIVVGLIGPVAVQLVTALWQGIVGMAGWLLGNIPGFIGNVISGFGIVVGLIGKVAVQLVTALWNGIVGMAGWLLGNIPGFIANVIAGFFTVVGLIGPVAVQMVTALWNGVMSMAGWLLGNIPGFIANVITGFAALAGLILPVAVQLVVALWNGIVSMAGWLLGNIPGFIGNFIAGFGIVTGLIWNVAVRLVTSLWQGIQSMVGWLVGNIPGFVGNLISGFASLPGRIWSVAVDLVVHLWQGIGSMEVWLIGQMASFVGSIISGFASLPGQIWQIAVNLVVGLWRGINSMGAWIIKQLTDWVSSVIPGPIKKALGIDSPSKVTAELGRHIVRGLAVGIRSTDDALVAMKDHSTALVNIARQGADAVNALTSDASTKNDYSFDSESRRVIVVQVEVSSKDGSIDGMSMKELASALSGSDLVRDMEHLAAVH